MLLKRGRMGYPSEPDVLGRCLWVCEELGHCAGHRGALCYPPGQLGEGGNVCGTDTAVCGDRVEVGFPGVSLCVCVVEVLTVIDMSR